MGVNPPPGKSYKTGCVTASSKGALLRSDDSAFTLTSSNEDGFYKEGNEYVVYVSPSAPARASDPTSGQGEPGSGEAVLPGTAT